MNEKRLCVTLEYLMNFIDTSFGTYEEKDKLKGFDLLVPIIESCAYNSYIETLGNKSDTIYLRAKNSLISTMEYAYQNYIKIVSNKFKLNEKKVILAFDYTDEDFYGNVQGFNIHGWNGERGVTGKFKFLTCSIVADCVPQKIPLISVPINLGHYKSSVVQYCLSLIKPLIGEIQLILFDRGFYDKDLMYELTKLNYPYLIFVPKHKDKKEILYPMKLGEQIAIYNNFEVNKNQSKYSGENILVFLKQIYDPRSERNYDWVFATNIGGVLLENIISTYKKRWRIETQFRVQDEARIKCKSNNMKIRYFLFLFEQMLQTIWICFFKEESSFKEFIISLSDMSRKWTKNPKA